VQIIGRYRDELGLLQFAHAFEQRTRVGEHRPPLVGTVTTHPSTSSG
jgi:Asp-tRNA(Asn)/Glu-tRNA(Gln) amidotransferase A subunit family amidase